MEKFIRHTGIGAPLRRSAVDTDQIIPAVYLKRITRTGFDDALFAAWRANEADFVLNREAYRRASILVAGPDFGTGSSREHAVWALKDYGFKVVLARASPTSSGETRASRAWSPASSARTTPSSCGRSWRPSPAPR